MEGERKGANTWWARKGKGAHPEGGCAFKEVRTTDGSEWEDGEEL